MSQPVVHFEIGGRDLTNLGSFYSQLFGWNMINHGPAAMITSNTGITGHMASLGHEPYNYVTVYIEVDDLDAYLKRVNDLGGSTVVPPTKIPGSWFAWFRDPEGTIIGLLKRDSKP
jgi:predicted enzyme related to lactoylglutathione lyase